MGVRVDAVMGTVVSIDVRDPGLSTPAIAVGVDAAIAWLHAVDARFSPYRETSEICRLDRGELAFDDCHPDVRHVLRACDDLRRATDGAFDARGHRPDGGFDPSGYVKGWAVDEAADVLVAAGARSFAINAGGDVLVRGEPSMGRPWRVGVRSPDEPGRVAAVLAVRDAAIATSGLYERGPHIRDPRSGATPRSFASITVMGPRLAIADAVATAAFAMGQSGPGWVAGQAGLGVLAIDAAGVGHWSDLVAAVLA